MTFIVKLLDDTESVDFLSTSYELADAGLVIELPEPKEVWGGDSIYANGAQLVMQTYNNAKATLTVNVHGATRDTLLDNVTKINRIIERAKQRSITESGSRVEFQYRWDSATRTTFYEVISGKVTWPENVMSVEQVHQQDASGNWVIYDIEVELVLSPFAYPISPVSGTPALVNLTKTNSPTPGTTKTVNNALESLVENWVEISSAQLVGSHPGVTKLTLRSGSGLAEGTSRVYIGCHVGGAFRSNLDDSEAVFRIGGVTPTTDTNSNKDTYSSLVHTSTDETVLAKWNLSAAEVAQMVGPFRFFGRTKDLSYWSTNANYRIGVSYNGTYLYKSEWRSPVETTVTLFDFGTIFLPPWSGSIINPAGLTIELLGMLKLAGTETLKLDYISLLPQDGGYRVLDFRGGAMAQNDNLVDDGWSKAVYHEAGGLRTGLAFALMPSITLQPGKTHRFYFLMEGSAHSSEISRTLDVSIGVVPAYMVIA